MRIEEYLRLARDAHQTQGALAGQRNVLTTTTAKRIRNRMLADIKLGAVLPPVVIGIVLSDEIFESLPVVSGPMEFIPEDSLKTLSIIDGMQRTAAILEAAADDETVLKRDLRVEFWLATSVRAMIYRMLVLNTGQVPWTISRQLSVVFAPLLEEIKRNVPELEKVPSPDSPGRRVGAAQYSTDAVIEMYLAFSLRKTSIDTREAVSDEFSRLDFVENLADNAFQGQFYGALSLLARLDKAFALYDPGASDRRYSRGRQIFDAQPARIGFIVAVGSAVLGRPGSTRSAELRAEKLRSVTSSATRLIERLEASDEQQLGDFLRLEVLEEVLDRRVGQVGRYERAVFAEAFKVLIEEDFEVENMEQCWRAN